MEIDQNTDSTSSTYAVAIKPEEDVRSRSASMEAHRKISSSNRIRYTHEEDNSSIDAGIHPSVHQLHDMVNEVKDVMRGLAQMQAAINHFHTNNLMQQHTSQQEQNSQFSSSSSNTDGKEQGNEGSVSAKGAAAAAAAVAAEGAKGTGTENTEAPPKKRIKTAFEKNLAMLNLRAKLKTRGKNARRRLHTINSRHLQMAAHHHHQKTDTIDLAIMQNRSVDDGSTPERRRNKSLKPQKCVLDRVGANEKPTLSTAGNDGTMTSATSDVSTKSDDLDQLKSKTQRKLTRRLSVGTLSVVGAHQKREKKMKRQSTISSSRSSIYDMQQPTRKSFCESTIIHPFNPLHTAWDCVVCLILMLVLWYMPLTLAFDEIAENTTGLSIFIDIIFGIDMIKQFRTGYITVDDEIVIMDPVLIAKKYLKTWFLADFVSCMPIDVIVISIMSASSPISVDDDVGVQTALRGTKSLKMLRLIRIAKLVRLMRVSRAFRYIRFFKSILEDKLKIEIPSSSIKLLRLLTLVIRKMQPCVCFLLEHFVMCCGCFDVESINIIFLNFSPTPVIFLSHFFSHFFFQFFPQLFVIGEHASIILYANCTIFHQKVGWLWEVYRIYH